MSLGRVLTAAALSNEPGWASIHSRAGTRIGRLTRPMTVQGPADTMMPDTEAKIDMAALTKQERRTLTLEEKRQRARENPGRISRATVDGMLIECRGSHLQDLFAYEVFFAGKRNGTYFECGALDGAYLSNTNIFERYFGWTGVLVEPITSQFEKIAVNRPAAKAYHACVGPEDTNVLFFNLRDGGLSGIAKEIGRKQIERFEFSYNNNPAGYAKHPEMLKLEWKPVIRTTRTITDAGFNHIDFFSLDVEGGESSVLSGLDFDNITVDVFCIEHNVQSKAAVTDRLLSLGYQAVATMGQDTFFAHDRIITRLAEAGTSLADRLSGTRVHHTPLISPGRIEA